MAISPRNSRHSKLRTLCAEWLRTKEPDVYEMLKKMAAEKYPKVSTSNDYFSTAALVGREARVHITSSPSGGEIYVDGKYFGDTPSDITLTAGEHAFKVTMGGKEWSRSVQITSGEIRVHAALAGGSKGGEV